MNSSVFAPPFALLLTTALWAVPSLADTVSLTEMAARLGLEDQNAANPSAKLAPKTEATPSGDGLTALVERLVARTLAAHPGLTAERATVTARAAGVDAARAAYQPVAAVSASVGRERDQDMNAHLYSYDAAEKSSLTVRENLYRGGQDERQIALATKAQLLAELSREAREQELSFNLKRAALQYNDAAMQQLLAEAATRDSEEFRRLTERKFSAGQVGKIDVHTANMRASDAKAQAVKAALSQHESYYSLVGVLGLPGLDDATLRSELAPLATASLPYPRSEPELAPVNTRPLNEQTAAISADKAELTLEQAYRSRYLPAIDLNAVATRTHGTTQTDLASSAIVPPGTSASSSSQTTALSVELELSWQLWARPADHQIAAAAAEHQAAAAKKTAAQIQGDWQMRQLRAHIHDLYQALPPYKEAYIEAGRLYEAQLKLYGAGAIDVFIVTNADSQRLTALRNWYSAVYDIKLALLRWEALSHGFIDAPAL